MSDKLFLLINSLSKQEKRYFKLFAGANREESNYLKLFDTLCKQETYDELAIKKKFIKEKFITQLHVTKNHLYTLILNCLHSYHANVSADSQIKKLLHYVEILYMKGLYDQCHKVLEQAKKLAHTHESHLSLIEIIEWQSKIAFNITKVSAFKNYVIDGYIKEIEIIKKLKNKNDFRKLFYEILILNNLGTPIRGDQDFGKYAEIINNPLLKNEKLATSYYSKMMFYYIKAYYLLNKGDIKESNKYNKMIVALIEANPIQIKESPINYVAALNNFIYASIQLKEFKHCFDAICKLRNIPEKYNLSNDLSSDLKEKIFIRSSYLELELYNVSGETKKALKLITELQLQINYWINIPLTRHKIFLLYTISVVYFEKSDYNNSLIWINKILNITETKEPVDIFCFARILNLLIHYELKNYDLIQSVHNSNVRFFNKRSRLYAFEIKIFYFIKNILLREPSQKKLVSSFILLKKELQDILKNDRDKKAIQYFDYIAWIDSKIIAMKTIENNNFR